MATALIALGSNLGDRRSNIELALKMLDEWPGVRLVACSASHSTHPVGGPAGQREFVNAAVLCETSLEPHEILAALQKIEHSLGRTRDGPRWSERPIDLDLLLFDDRRIDSPDLTVPHPRMAYRRFVIEPSAEIAPEMRHPAIGWTLTELRDHLRNAAPYVAIAGAAGAGKSQLASAVASAVGGRLLSDPVAETVASSSLIAAGPTSDSEIEFLRLRTEQLKDARLAARATSKSATATVEENGDLAISDYWFEQSLCYVAETLAPDDFVAYQDRWQVAAAQVPKPKLLVLLDAPVDFLCSRFKSRKDRPAWMNRKRYQLVHAAIVDRVSQSHRGPLLRLDSRQTTYAQIELLGAIEAMR
jgi:2-amino-4-hydroxy-6-hydroxymethyldihydropteridine diphosphokinase